MRINLVSMLDELGLPEYLGISTSADLFGLNALKTGSILKYPVIKNLKNYPGHSPDPVKHPVLRNMVEMILVPELEDNVDCLIVPLGKSVENVLAYCSKQGVFGVPPVW